MVREEDNKNKIKNNIKFMRETKRGIDRRRKKINIMKANIHIRLYILLNKRRRKRKDKNII